MTPSEYRAQANLIKATRSLRPHELGDLETQCCVVESFGKSRELDDFYLKIVGVPASGVLVRPKPKQLGLF
jgi:hypothetical protein